MKNGFIIIHSPPRETSTTASVHHHKARSTASYQTSQFGLAFLFLPVIDVRLSFNDPSTLTLTPSHAPSVPYQSLLPMSSQKESQQQQSIVLHEQRVRNPWTEQATCEMSKNSTLPIFPVNPLPNHIENCLCIVYSCVSVNRPGGSVRHGTGLHTVKTSQNCATGRP